MAGENNDNADGDDKLEWNMEFIGEIVESAVDIMAEYLKGRNRKIYWPFMVRDEDGTSYAYDYYNEDLEEEETENMNQEGNQKEESKTLP